MGVHEHYGQLQQGDVAGLAAALGGKADDAAVVHNTGTETISGVKTFGSPPVVPTGSAAGHPVRRDDARLADPRPPTALRAAGDYDNTTAPAANQAILWVPGTSKWTPTTVVLEGDARLTDTRTPGDGSVTNAKVSASAAIAESKLALASDAAAGTASRRTLGTGSTQAAAGNDSRITGAVPNTRTITAGAGLTGGGDLSADRTLALGTVSSARKYRANMDTTSPNGSPVAIALGSVGYSRGTAVSTATANALVAVVAGMYHINATLYFVGGGAGVRTLFVSVNGTNIGQIGYPVPASQECRPLLSIVYILAAGDAVTLNSYAEGTAPTVRSSSAADIGLTLTYLGP